MVTPKLYKLSTNSEVQQQCVEYVKIDSNDEAIIRAKRAANNQSNTLEQLVDSPCEHQDETPLLGSPSFPKIFSFYCKLQGDKDYYSYLQENNLSAHHIHEWYVVTDYLLFISSYSIQSS